MTISQSTSPLTALGLLATADRRGAIPSHGLSEVENSVEFRIGPGCTPAQSVRRACAFVEKVLPALLVATPNDRPLAEAVLSVLTELVDITARHRADIDLGGRVSCDRDHVLITVGEMDRPLPGPHAEPGLFLVHRLVDDIGQYCGEGNGYATWASIPVVTRYGLSLIHI